MSGPLGAAAVHLRTATGAAFALLALIAAAGKATSSASPPSGMSSASIFAFQPSPFVGLAIVALFVTLTFVPILSVHPFRVAELRSFTRLVTALWAVAAIGAVANPFPSPLWVKVLLAATAAGLSGVGAFRALLDRTAK